MMESDMSSDRQNGVDTMRVVSQGRIVIIGGGFAGMAAIQSLVPCLAVAEQPTIISLVDASPGHTLITEIPYVLERDLNMTSRMLDFSSMLQGSGVEFQQRRVRGLDHRYRTILLADGGSLDYDYALLAVETEAAFPHVPGLHRHAWPVRTASDAIGIIKALRQAPRARIVIAGGAFTGVELAASVKGHQVTLLEAKPSLLPNMLAPYGQYARDFLEHSGVEVILSVHLVHVDASTIHTDSGGIPYDLLIWAGGIKPPHWLQESNIPCGPEGYPIADPWGRIDHHLFVAGDLWRPQRSQGRRFMQTAETAQAMGSYVGRVMAATVLGQRLPAPFHHGAHGMIVSLGASRGVGWVLTPRRPLHGRLAGELKHVALARYCRKIAHRANSGLHVS